MAPTDTATLLDQAEQHLLDAATAAVDTYLSLARSALLGDTGAVAADASAADLPPDLDRWPGSSVWWDLVRRFLAPAIETVFDLAFDTAARSDALQVHRYRQTFMDTVYDRLSEALWPRDAFDRIRGDLAEGLDAGESVPQLRNRVADELSVERYSYLAERIARTEAHTAVEGGNHSASLAWEQASGDTLYQRWIATADERTRPDHLAASGQTVRIGEPFTVGGAPLDYPGDPAGPAAQTVNCRCSTLTGTAAELDELPPSPADTTQGAGAMPDDTYPYADTPAPAEPAPPPGPVRWRGILAPLEQRADYRILAAPAANTVPVNDQMWLSYQERSGDRHNGKVTVGRIDRAWIHEGDLWGEGVFDMADASGTTAEVVRKIADGFAGTVSIDLADGEVEYRLYDTEGNEVEIDYDDPDGVEAIIDRFDAGEIKELAYITDWRLGGATLLQDPAFHTAAVFLVQEESGAVTAAATGDDDLPLAARDRSWDGPAALRNLAEAGELDRGTFWRADEAEPGSDVQADYKLPFADIIDGTLTAVPAGIFGAAAALQGARGGVDLPEADAEAVRDRIGDYYERMRDEWDDETVRAPWDNDDDDDGDDAVAASALTASGDSWAERVASAVPANPPAAWFADPKLSGLTKVRVTEQGRVYGHIADWSQRHIGHLGQPMYPPRCPNGGAYGRFHRQPVRTAEGTRVATGPLTTAGHASTDRTVTMSAAMAHYDDPRFVVANVVCGEDQYGIWVAGSLRPGVEAWQVAFADTYSFSGDWRFGELVAACTVSVEGFFVPADDSVHALAASAGIAPQVGRVRARVQDAETVALVSAGLVKPTRADAERHRGSAAMLRVMRTGHQSLAAQISELPGKVASMAYDQAMRAMRDKEELERIAAEVNAPVRDEVEEMAAQIGVR